MSTIVRFGETCPETTNQWYELADGSRIICDEDTLNKIWSVWVCKENSRTDHKEDESVYIFAEPTEVDLLKPAFS